MKSSDIRNSLEDVRFSDDFLQDRIKSMMIQEKTYKCIDYLSLTKQRNSFPTTMGMDNFADFGGNEYSRRKKTSLPCHFRSKKENDKVFAGGSSPSSVRVRFEGDYVADKNCQTQNAKKVNTSLSTDEIQNLKLWRQKMCLWAYHVVDSNYIDREIVSVAFSYFDRYIASVLSKSPISKQKFQLSSMTSLYLAFKLMLSEYEILPISYFVDMSRGGFTYDQFESMEKEILSSLNWRMNPPTAMSFLNHFFNFSLPNITSVQRDHLMSRSRHLTELAVGDYFCVSHRASSVAIASVLVAASDEFGSTIPIGVREKFIDELERMTGLETQNDEVYMVQVRLEKVYHKGGYNQ